MIDFGQIKTKVSSIQVKFTLIVLSVGLLLLGATAFLSDQFTAREFEKHYREKALLIGKYIIQDLEEGMVRKVHQKIFGILDAYREREVVELRVFDRKGQEVFGQKEGPPEERVEETLKTGNLVHFHKEINKREVATYIIPVRNKTECHGCHGKSGELNGALLMSIPLDEMKESIAQQNRKYSFLLGFMAVAICLTTLLTVNRLFLHPLRRLQEGTEAIEKGDFKYQIPVTSGDEIGTLTKNFNRMAQTLRNLFEKIEHKGAEWQQTFDSIADPVSVIDQKGNIIRANRAFKEYFSLPLREAVPMNYPDLLATHFSFPLPEKIGAQDQVSTTHELYDKKTGKILQVSIFPYYSPERNFIGSVQVAKDITEKKEAEIRLIMNERLAALGQMASGIAHEIRNPLATIRACAEGLLQRMEKKQFDAALFESYLKIIDEEIILCTRIITSMLSFLRKKGEAKEDVESQVDIHEVLDRTLEMISFQGRLKEVEVLKNYQERMPPIRGNEGELRQVFISIILNALDAMEDKGRLELETAIEGNTVFIKIRDTGPGIPSDFTGRIFDPFFTTRPEKGGTGLGLSIANKIIKENNGEIVVATNEGKGTTFTITLPRQTASGKMACPSDNLPD